MTDRNLETQDFCPSPQSLPNSSCRSETIAYDHPPLESHIQILLDQILSNPSLPSPPSVAFQIVRMVSNLDCEISELAQVLRSDPAICAKLLKTVNSWMFGLKKPVVTIERAIAILGLYPLRSLVLGFAIPAIHARVKRDKNLQDYWRESVSGAMIARELSMRFKDPSAEETFISGLLRDLGIMILRQTFPHRCKPEDGKEFWGERQCAWEESVYGIDHATVSAGLLSRWNLPEEVIEPVRNHHYPHRSISPNQRILDRTNLLDFSSRLARLELLSEDSEALQEVLQIAEERYRLPIDELEEFLTDVCPKIETFAQILEVDIGSSPQYASILSEGCAELARLSIQTGMTNHSHMVNLSGMGSASAAIDLRKSSLVVGGGKAVYSPELAYPRYTLDFIDRLGEPDFNPSIHNYQLLSMLGKGGMGVVLKAYDVALNRFVALKMITPELAKSEKAIQGFTREGRTAAALLHENVVTIFTVSEYLNVPFLVMEYVDGKSLQEHLESGRRFRVEEIVRIGKEVAQGLSAAHRLNIIHRDVKPANILLRREGERVQLTDFGLARVLNAAKESFHEGSISGTPNYMSPEQADGKSVNFATDVFSLGSVLYTLCTGKPPFAGYPSIQLILEAVRIRNPKPVPDLNPDIPETMIELIEALLAKSPKDRPSMEMTAEILKEIELSLY